MTHIEICRAVAKKCSISEDEARRVVDCLISTAMEAMVEGDEVKLRGLGVLYSRTYNVWKGKLEFGTTSEGGERRRVRFRPFESTNQSITAAWKSRPRRR